MSQSILFSASSKSGSNESSSTLITAFTSACFNLNSISWSFNMCVAGITIAPILWSATIQNHHSNLFFKVSITLSPFLMPNPLSKLTVLLEYSLISLNVNVWFSSSSLVQINATLSGSISAYLSTTSKPKLKSGSYVNLKFFLKSS